MDNIIKSYMTREGLQVTVYKSGKRTINGMACGVSSLSDLELAAANGLRRMPPLDSPSLAGMPRP